MSEIKQLTISMHLKNFFSRKVINQTGNLGLYQEIIGINMGEVSDQMNYKTSVKLKALAQYGDVVEVEIVDVATHNLSNQEVKDLIKKNMPKYIRVSSIKWEVK